MIQKSKERGPATQKCVGKSPIEEVLSLPGEGSTSELLDEDLTAVLNSFDVRALPRVMFTPVLLLFH